MNWTLLPATAFAVHAARWDALRARGPAAPVLEAGFIASLIDTFGSGAELLALCEDAEGLLAAAVLAPQGRARWATFQPAQAPIGPWLQRPGTDTDALLAGLARALPGVALLVGLTQCDPFLLPRRAGPDASADYIDTARITVSGSFEAWWEGRGKNLRANLRKQRNRLAAAGVATRLEIWDQAGQMAQAVADYGRLEGSGWKGRVGTAVGADDQQGRFYRTMLEWFCAHGRASVYRYHFNDTLVAMDLCIEQDDCIVVLKTAYDESVPGQYSPALLMREDACRHLFGQGRVRRIEFYGKVMEWHTRWTEEIRTMYHLNHYRWSLLGRLHAMRRRAAVPPAAPAGQA